MVFLHARLSSKEDVGQDVYEDQKVMQISRFVVLTGPAADEILELYFVRLIALGLPVT